MKSTDPAAHDKKGPLGAAARQTAFERRSNPRTACGSRGIPSIEPGVSFSAPTGIAAATRTAVPAAR